MSEEQDFYRYTLRAAEIRILEASELLADAELPELAEKLRVILAEVNKVEEEGG